MIVVDTSALIAGLCGSRPLGPALRSTIEAGERLALPALVLYEWLCGPRLQEELDLCERLVPERWVLGFGAAEAAAAADLYRTVRRPRRRAADLAIAASALTRDAPLWTANRADFEDIPGLRLFEPPFG